MRAARVFLPLLAALTFLCASTLSVYQAAAQEKITAFERAAINSGLPPKPDTFDLSTPQTALESFLQAAEAGNWALASHALDLDLVPEEAQAQQGPDLAEHLFVILDRKVLLRWSDLPERPDALQETGGKDMPRAGEARRSLLLGILTLDGREVAVRINRVRPEDGEARWLFSAQTVAKIPALFAEYGPSEIEKSIPRSLQVETIFGLRLWELIFLPLAIIVIGLLAWATWRLATWLSARANYWFLQELLRGARLPASMAVAAALLTWLTSGLLAVSSAASAIIAPIVLLTYVGSIILLIVNAIDAVLDHVVDTDPGKMSSPENAEERSLATGISAARRFLLVIALLVASGIVLSSANIFRTLGFSLLASAGVVTLIIAFAAREVLGNILASLQISLNRSARLGDFLEFEGQWCTVERIYFTYVQLRLWTGNRLIVPVSYFVRQPFENWSCEEFKMLRLVELKLASDAEVQPLRERMMAFADEDERISPVDEAFCYVTRQDEFGKTVLFAVPVPVPDVGWKVECDLREHLIDEAARLGVAFPAEPPRPDPT